MTPFLKCKALVKESGMQENVLFKGKMSKKEWIEISKNYHIFLNTTNVDNLPVSVIEAMALGMIIVSTNAGGVPFLIDDKKMDFYLMLKILLRV